jgi:hypothetical protein
VLRSISDAGIEHLSNGGLVVDEAELERELQALMLEDAPLPPTTPPTINNSDELEALHRSMAPERAKVGV